LCVADQNAGNCKLIEIDVATRVGTALTSGECDNAPGEPPAATIRFVRISQCAGPE
jgi:hypothetical protein